MDARSDTPRSTPGEGDQVTAAHADPAPKTGDRAVILPFPLKNPPKTLVVSQDIFSSQIRAAQSALVDFHLALMPLIPGCRDEAVLRVLIAMSNATVDIGFLLCDLHRRALEIETGAR